MNELNQQLANAIALASKYHKNQADKQGVPYILHPLTLLARLRAKGACLETQITAVLHDIVEDTPITIDDLRKKGYSINVLTAIALLTHGPDDDYPAMIEKLSHNRIARDVKLEDLTHNLDPTRLKDLTQRSMLRTQKYHTAYTFLTACIRV